MPNSFVRSVDNKYANLNAFLAGRGTTAGVSPTFFGLSTNTISFFVDTEGHRRVKQRLGSTVSRGVHVASNQLRQNVWTYVHGVEH